MIAKLEQGHLCLREESLRFDNKINNKDYHTGRTIPKSNIDTPNTQLHDQISIPLTHNYMTAHFPWYRYFNKEWLD